MTRDARRELVRRHRAAVFVHGRAVRRLRPYQTFHSPPGHVHQASDGNEKLLHGSGDALPW